MKHFVLLFLLIASFIATPLPSSAQTTAESNAAMETAEFLSYLESIGDSNGLFDMIHPDAHAIIPRAAVIGWYENTFFPLGPGVATATGVRFVEWTWPVNGKTYPYTAEVSFIQSFADGSVVDEVVRLVQDEQGQWRWFFGRSLEFVNQQIALYASQPPDTVYQASDPIEAVSSQLDSYWSSAFRGAGLQYASPGIVVIYDRSVTSACGVILPQEGPGSYCFLDSTIYLDVPFLAYFESTYGDFAWITVLAHEWGHHVQKELNVMPFGDSRFELQADCLAGSFARDAATLGLLNEGDVTEAVAISAASGDPIGLPKDEAGAHGSSDDRITSFMRGYLDGFIGCNLPLMSTGSPSANLPPLAVMQAPTLDDLLPTLADVPAGMALTASRSRTLEEVAANYTDPVETADLFALMGWAGNVTASFESSSGPVSSIYVSIHQFATAEDAEIAMKWSSADQQLSTGAQLVRALAVGESSLAIVVGNGSAEDYTLYAQTGPYVIRVTASGASTETASVAHAVAGSIVRKVVA